MTICPGKDGSGVACSHPQSICIARGFVQWGPRSPSGWAYQQSASFVQLSAMLRPPAPAACIPASAPLLPVCSWVHTCHCTHTHRLAVSLPSPSSPANALASRHWSWCQYSEGRDCRLLWLGLTCAII